MYSTCRSGSALLHLCIKNQIFFPPNVLLFHKHVNIILSKLKQKLAGFIHVGLRAKTAQHQQLLKKSCSTNDTHLHMANIPASFRCIFQGHKHEGLIGVAPKNSKLTTILDRPQCKSSQLMYIIQSDNSRWCCICHGFCSK